MTRTEFWALIESVRNPDPDRHVEQLTNALAGRSADDILAFGHLWDAAHDDAYSWGLWGAAYLMNGGCSDDGFHYFRSWLLLQGEDVYVAALKEPDTLAKVRIQSDDAECECYPAQDAYGVVMGDSDHDAYYKMLAARYGSATPRPEPAGEEWDFDDEEEMKKRLPKLFKKYSDA